MVNDHLLERDAWLWRWDHRLRTAGAAVRTVLPNRRQSITDTDRTSAVPVGVERCALRASLWVTLWVTP